PEGRHPVQHLPLERDGAEDDVERADPVAHDDRAAAVERVAVAYLPLVLVAELVKRCAVERLAELRLDGLDGDHDVPFPVVAESGGGVGSMIVPACRSCGWGWKRGGIGNEKGFFPPARGSARSGGLLGGRPLLLLRRA